MHEDKSYKKSTSQIIFNPVNLCTIVSFQQLYTYILLNRHSYVLLNEFKFGASANYTAVETGITNRATKVVIKIYIKILLIYRLCSS